MRGKLHKLHQELLAEFDWYERWHNHPLRLHAHWLAIVTILFGSIVGSYLATREEPLLVTAGHLSCPNRPSDVSRGGSVTISGSVGQDTTTTNRQPSFNVTLTDGSVDPVPGSAYNSGNAGIYYCTTGQLVPGTRNPEDEGQDPGIAPIGGSVTLTVPPSPVTLEDATNYYVYGYIIGTPDQLGFEGRGGETWETLRTRVFRLDTASGGTSATSGPTGSTGTTGTGATSGPTGGPTGATGTTGPTGGSTGTSGTSGTAGPTGTTSPGPTPTSSPTGGTTGTSGPGCVVTKKAELKFEPEPEKDNTYTTPLTVKVTATERLDRLTINPGGAATILKQESNAAMVQLTATASLTAQATVTAPEGCSLSGESRLKTTRKAAYGIGQPVKEEIPPALELEHSLIEGEVRDSLIAGELVLTFGQPAETVRQPLLAELTNGQLKTKISGQVKAAPYRCTLDGRLVAGELTGETTCEVGEAKLISSVPLTGRLTPAPGPTPLASRLVASLVTASLPLALPLALNAIETLQLLFVGYLPRRKRPAWGLVEDQYGLPVYGALVQLGSLALKRVVARQVTDREGRFAFLISQPGQYLLKVSHPQYEAMLGQPFSVTEPAQPVADQRITMRNSQVTNYPNGERRNFVYKLQGWKRIGERFQSLHYPILLLGLIVNGLNVFSLGNLTPLPIGLFVAYSLLLMASLLTSRLLARPYGLTIDSATSQALPLTLIRALAHLEGRTQIAATAVTDERGRYRLLLKPGDYELVATKALYQKTAEPQSVKPGKLPALTLRMVRAAFYQ